MKKGFTLIELLAVIAIIAMLTLIVIVTTANLVKDKKGDITDTELKILKTEMSLYSSKNNNFLVKDKFYERCIPALDFVDDSTYTKAKIEELYNVSDITSMSFLIRTINASNFNIELVDTSTCVEGKIEVVLTNSTTFGGNNGIDKASRISSAYNKYYITGTAGSTDGDFFSIGTTNRPPFVFRVDSDFAFPSFGQSRGFDTVSNSTNKATTIFQNSRDELIIAGQTENELYIADIDSEFNSSSGNPFINGSNAYITDVVEYQGFYYIVGNSTSNIAPYFENKRPNPASTEEYGFVGKLSDTFSVQWIRGIGGSNKENFTSIKVKNDTVYAVGTTESNDYDFAGELIGHRDVVLSKLDLDGNLIESVINGFASKVNFISNCIFDDYIYCAGRQSVENLASWPSAYTSQLFIAKFDYNFNPIKYEFKNDLDNTLVEVNRIKLLNDKLFVLGTENNGTSDVSNVYVFDKNLNYESELFESEFTPGNPRDIIFSNNKLLIVGDLVSYSGTTYNFTLDNSIYLIELSYE